MSNVRRCSESLEAKEPSAKRREQEIHSRVLKAMFLHSIDGDASERCPSFCESGDRFDSVRVEAWLDNVDLDELVPFEEHFDLLTEEQKCRLQDLSVVPALTAEELTNSSIPMECASVGVGSPQEIGWCARAGGGTGRGETGDVSSMMCTIDSSIQSVTESATDGGTSPHAHVSHPESKS